MKHLRDLRLLNNAGMDYPLCRADDELLDTEVHHDPEWQTTANAKECDCLDCWERAGKAYPWYGEPVRNV